MKTNFERSVTEMQWLLDEWGRGEDPSSNIYVVMSMVEQMSLSTTCKKTIWFCHSRSVFS